MAVNSKPRSQETASADPAAYCHWIRARLGIDHGLAPEDGRKSMTAEEIERAASAAVLVPLVNRREQVTVLLTQRTPHLNAHAGQISFPGGRAEAQDRSIEETALRETEEEIGLSRAQVTLLGQLPDHYVPTGFRVSPIVGWVEPPFSLKLDEFEVAQAFEVPLDFFLDSANHKRESAIRNGRLRHFYVMPYQGHNIWGATAAMLVTLARILHG
jgi:8-oxo-dGTP pyrophosphatase MutT (NUDIX family)